MIFNRFPAKNNHPRKQAGYPSIPRQRLAFCRIDPNRSKRAFQELIQDWRGILVSDRYGLYRNGVDGRQACLAHLIRKAVGLSERRTLSIKLFGQTMTGFLRKLVSFAHALPSPETWNDFYVHLHFTLKLFEDEKDDAGKLAPGNKSGQTKSTVRYSI